MKLVNDVFFNEFTLDLGREARPIVRTLAERGVLAGVSLGRLYPGASDLENGLVVAVTDPYTERPGRERYAQPAPPDAAKHVTYCGT